MTKNKKGQTNTQNRRAAKTITKNRPAPPQKPKGVQESQKAGLLSSFLKKTRGWFFATLAICGFLFGIYNYYPHVSIQETTLVQSYNPFYYPFIIKNTGKIRVINFSYDLKVGEIITEGDNIFTNFGISGFADTIQKIKVNGSNPIKLPQVFEIPYGYVKSCKIFIRYKYSIPIFKIHFSDSTKFVLFKDSFRGYTWKEYQY